MSKLQLRPSAAVIVKANTPISECVRKMRDSKIGSILVMDQADDQKLVGIFTERDLLKWFDQLQVGGHWEKAVSLIMSKPVTAITATELPRAGEIMLEKGIRHLPVIFRDENGDEHLAGVISMRDLFREIMRDRPAWLELQAKLTQLPKVSVIAARESEMRSLLSVLRQLKTDALEGYAMDSILQGEDLPPLFHRFSWVAIDIDSMSDVQWSKAIRKLNRGVSHPRIMVFFTPSRHEAKNVEALKKIADSERFFLFEKPYGIFEVLEQIVAHP